MSLPASYGLSKGWPIGCGQAAPAVPVIPNAPTLGAVTASNGQLSLAFTDGATGGSPITGHKVYRGTLSGGEALLGNLSGASPFVDTGLTNGTPYYYKLSAVNAVGESPLSNEVSGVPGATVPPLPSGAIAMWDPASLSALADGATVTSWTDATGGIVAANTSDSTTPNTYVANSGGLPAVRLSGEAVMVTSGSNALTAALNPSSPTFTALIVARNIQDSDGDQDAAHPALLSMKTSDPRSCLLANTSFTGRYSNGPAAARLTNCTTGLRTISITERADIGTRYLGINGTAIADNPCLGGDQLQIGGWKDRNDTLFCGKADILAIIVWNRALTAAELKQVHHRYCQLTGQALPGGGTQPITSFSGDSLTGGYQTAQPEDFHNSYGYQMASALGWDWGTFDLFGFDGDPWSYIQARSPQLGDVHTALGVKNIVCLFEYANTGGTTASVAQPTINALKAQDSTREIIFGTSTSDRQTNNETNRAAYNADCSNLTGVTTLVPLHLDPNIGVSGAAPANGSGGNAYYQNDGTHLTTVGYALLDNGPHGFRPAVQARLAA